jgi:hypothetical protein
MGWCSGTSIFDAVAEFVLKTDRPDDEKSEVLFVLADAMASEDWDCEDDSAYAGEPLVKAVFIRVWPSRAKYDLDV